MKKCARCYRELEGVSVENLCLECFVSTRGIDLVHRVELEACQVCGRVRIGGRWLADDRELLKAIRERVRSTYRKALGKYGLEVNEAEVSGEDFRIVLTDGEKRSSVYGKLNQKVKKTVCPICVREKTERHESIIQLRFEARRDREEIATIARNILGSLPSERSSDVISVEELREGVDIKVHSHSAARSIVSYIRSRYPAEVKETHKLITERGGKRRSMLTISVRLLEAGGPRVALLRGRPALITEVHPGRLRVLTADGSAFLSDRKSLEREIRPFKGREELVVIIGDDVEGVRVRTQDGDELTIPQARVAGPISVGSRAIIAVDELGDMVLFPLY